MEKTICKTVTIQQGNSCFLMTLPKSMAKILNLEPKDTVILKLINNQIIVERA